MEKNNKNKVKIIIGSLVIIAIIIITIVGFIINKKSNSVKDTVSNLENNSKDSSISKVENNSQNKEIEITNSDKITIDNFCEFNIIGTSFSKDIIPTNPTGYYTYLQGKDDSQKYFELTMNVKNLQSSAVKQDSLISVKIKYDNNFEYTCMLATEDASGNELENYPNLYNIEPLKSLKYRFIAEVPIEVENDNKPIKATIKANGNTYIYNVR